jgi:hypothetical protein
MDATYVATPMTAMAEMPDAVVLVVNKGFALTTLVNSQVATTLRPLSIGGTSLSAVSPDYSSRKELALAGV